MGGGGGGGKKFFNFCVFLNREKKQNSGKKQIIPRYLPHTAERGLEEAVDVGSESRGVLELEPGLEAAGVEEKGGQVKGGGVFGVYLNLGE